MLISHVHKFIYIKTRKTASTSVEGVLEQFCLPPGFQSDRQRGEVISEYGYATGRMGGGEEGDYLKAHTNAQTVMETVGPEIWNTYRKVYCVRNPFDKVISWWWHAINDAPPGDWKADLSAFRTWLLSDPKLPTDQGYYKAGGDLFPATRIRYEHMQEDLADFIRSLGAPDYAAGDVPSWRRNTRKHKARGWQEYYDEATAAAIRNRFTLDFEHFGYDADAWKMQRAA